MTRNQPDGLPAHKLQRPVFARLPCGKLATRRSYRSYTHVVAVPHDDKPCEWRVLGWCGSRSLAEKLSAETRAGKVSRIIEVFE